MELYTKDLWSQNGSCPQLNNGMIGQLLWIETRGKVGERKRN